MSDIDEQECEICGHQARGRLIAGDHRAHVPGDLIPEGPFWYCSVCYGSPAGMMTRRSVRSGMSSQTEWILKTICYAANEVIDAIERQAKP